MTQTPLLKPCATCGKSFKGGEYDHACKACSLAESRKMLERFIKPGQTVYTVLRHASRSGMMRHISLVVPTGVSDGVRSDMDMQDVSGWAAHLMGMKRDDSSGGIKVGGCGMDMGFHLVYNLAWAMYGKGGTVQSIGRDVGYDLKQRWI